MKEILISHSLDVDWISIAFYLRIMPIPRMSELSLIVPFGAISHQGTVFRSERQLLPPVRDQHVASYGDSLLLFPRCP